MLLRTWTQGIILKVKSLKSYTEEYVRKQNSSSTEGQKLTPQHFAVYNFILQMRNAIFVPFIASYFSWRYQAKSPIMDKSYQLETFWKQRWEASQNYMRRLQEWYLASRPSSPGFTVTCSNYSLRRHWPRPDGNISSSDMGTLLRKTGNRIRNTQWSFWAE